LIYIEDIMYSSNKATINLGNEKLITSLLKIWNIFTI
jgi:hypothetical protein